MKFGVNLIFFGQSLLDDWEELFRYLSFCSVVPLILPLGYALVSQLLCYFVFGDSVEGYFLFLAASFASLSANSFP
jgi:hypothetical protein